MRDEVRRARAVMERRVAEALLAAPIRVLGLVDEARLGRFVEPDAQAVLDAARCWRDGLDDISDEAFLFGKPLDEFRLTALTVFAREALEAVGCWVEDDPAEWQWTPKRLAAAVSRSVSADEMDLSDLADTLGLLAGLERSEGGNA